MIELYIENKKIDITDDLEINFTYESIDPDKLSAIKNYHLPSLLKLMSIESMMPSNQVILCRPLLFLPSKFPSIRVPFSDSDLLIRWPKYWSFSISPSNEYQD